MWREGARTAKEALKILLEKLRAPSAKSFMVGQETAADALEYVINAPVQIDYVLRPNCCPRADLNDNLISPGVELVEHGVYYEHTSGSLRPCFKGMPIECCPYCGTKLPTIVFHGTRAALRGS